MQEGSRVRFLNQTGGGIVSAVKNGMCTVTDDEGWEWKVKIAEVVEITQDPDKEKESIANTIGRVRQDDGKSAKKSPKEHCTEIDLHGDKLCSGITSPVAIHIRQKQTICSVLEREKHNHGHRIVFIHGKGDGTLRGELIKELKARSSFFIYEDAPFAEYGYHGAIKVIVK